MKVLAMDAGQTGIRARMLVDGQLVGEIECPGVLTDRPVLPQLAEVARQVDPPAGTTLAVGSSGLGAEDTAARLFTETRGLGIVRTIVAHDSITSYLGAISDEPGAVIAAGTGVVTLALGERELARVDGWGYLIGDAGSGFWIGRAGLDAVLRQFDGRGPATALTDVVTADFPDLADAYLQLQADEFRVARIASYARTVAELAPDDEVCAGICRRAAAELVTSVVAGLEKVGQGSRPDPLVSTVGKVFNGTVLRTEFAKLLGGRFEAVRLSDAAGTGLDGAAKLAELRKESPLWQQVSHAA